MELTSTSITDGADIALRYAEGDSGGENVTPQLSWSGAPDDTKSFAITIYDPDAPTGSGWWHWVAADIPASVTEIGEGAGAPAGAREAENDFGYVGYGGACPPPGPAHRYIHTVHALSVKSLDAPADASSAVLRMNIMTNSLDQASITGTFAQPDQ